MKQILVACIHFYQTYLSLPLRLITGATFSCKFSPTCSEYAVSVIEERGVVKGGAKALGRLISCQPFGQKA